MKQPSSQTNQVIFDLQKIFQIYFPIFLRGKPDSLLLLHTQFCAYKISDTYTHTNTNTHELIYFFISFFKYLVYCFFTYVYPSTSSFASLRPDSRKVWMLKDFGSVKTLLGCKENVQVFLVILGRYVPSFLTANTELADKKSTFD